MFDFLLTKQRGCPILTIAGKKKEKVLLSVLAHHMIRRTFSNTHYKSKTETFEFATAEPYAYYICPHARNQEISGVPLSNSVDW